MEGDQILAGNWMTNMGVEVNLHNFNSRTLGKIAAISIICALK